MYADRVSHGERGTGRARREWLSALFDGECGHAAADPTGWEAADDATWDAYHCIGEAMRASAAAQLQAADPAFVRAVAERFHAACRTGVQHGSCTTGNVLAFQRDGNWRVVFAPSPNVSFSRRLREEEQLDMLAQFAASAGEVSRTMALRFDRECFGGSPVWMKHETVRWVWREVERRMRRFAAGQSQAEK